MNVEDSLSIEEEGVARGYYTGLLGIVLKFFMGTMFVLLFLAAQTADQSTQWLVTLLFAIYVSGWMVCRQAGIRDIPAYRAIIDVLSIGIFFGFILRIVEGIVLMATSGVFDQLDRLSPFSGFEVSLFQNALMMTAIALAVASVAEELFYRGSMIYMVSFLTDGYALSDMTAKFIALEVQAFLFAVLHAAVYSQWAQILALFAGGNLLGLLFLWKRDLSVCIIAHLSLNLSSLAPVVGNWLVANPIPVILAFAATLGIIILILMRRSNTYEE